MNLRSTIHDHNTKQRLHALRGYAKKADRLDDRETWIDAGKVLAVWLVIAVTFALWLVTK